MNNFSIIYTLKRKNKVCNFLIKNNKEQSSSTFRIWTQKNDCYFAVNGTASEHKYSFHQDGQCQYGLSSELRKSLTSDSNWLGKSRLYDTWKAKTDLDHNQGEKLLEIILPLSLLSNSKTDSKAKLKQNNTINLNYSQKKSVASIIIFKFNIKENSKIDINKGSVELARLPLQNGYFVIIFVRSIKEEIYIWKNYFYDGLNSLYNSKNTNDRKYINREYKKFNNIKIGTRAQVGCVLNNQRFLFEGDFNKIKNLVLFQKL